MHQRTAGAAACNPVPPVRKPPQKVPVPDPRIFRPSQTLLAAAAFVLAALFSALIAWGAALVIESRSAAAVTSRLLTEG